MITCSLSDQPLSQQNVKCYVFFIEEGTSFLHHAEPFIKTEILLLETLSKERSFTGKKGSTFLFPFLKNESIVYLMFVGLGKKQNNYFP